ncbi:hypothetical protein G3I43_18355 [Streptomyces anulatus]|uniref:Uncharacterized protein n=1 Tax=Streptomyces anulatus TaxID=1892 RepID=A0A6G3ST95_STRAQ|nr:hypothetical protein [Streptomyces anulatus]
MTMPATRLIVVARMLAPRTYDSGQRPQGERAQGERAQGERAQGERAQGERPQGERADQRISRVAGGNRRT